jgi:iron complex outermembrane receptor protein
MTPPNSVCRALRLLAASGLALLFLVAGATAQTASTSLTGTVLHQASGDPLANARVSLDGTPVETFTDQFGRFRLDGLMAGPIAIAVYYTGLQPERRQLNLRAGESREEEFRLLMPFAKAGDDKSGLVKLDAFVVAAARETTAALVAINDQRFAPNIKSVVATDSFGDIAEGNIGEFVKFLPGVSVEGGESRTITVGGVPPTSTPITVDGNRLASAASGAQSRTTELEVFSITGMSRVEVLRSPTPDSPADAIGGTVNLVSRSAFERSKAQHTFKAYVLFREGNLDFKRTADPFPNTLKVRPNFEFSSIVPLNQRFGVSVSGLQSSQWISQDGMTNSWLGTNLASTATLPAPAANQPYLGRFNFSNGPKQTDRTAVSLSADYRLSPRDTVSAGIQYTYFHAHWTARGLAFNLTNAESYGPTFSQSRPGTGTVVITSSTRSKRGTTAMPSLRYRHYGPVWTAEAGGAYSRATNHYRDYEYGHMNSLQATLSGVTLRFENPGEQPPVIRVTNAAGAPVDPYLLSNYTLNSGNTNGGDSQDEFRSFYANLRRDLPWRVPVRIKAGLDVRSQSRDIRSNGGTRSFSRIGPDGRTNTADDNAGQWLDDEPAGRKVLWGLPNVQWLDPFKLYRDYKANPAHYSEGTDAQLAAAHRSLVNGSYRLTETVGAPYLRTDLRLLDERLWVVAGVRYEETRDEGAGPRVDPAGLYERDAAGNILRNPNGTAIVKAASGSLAGARLQYFERGTQIDTKYGDYFPSLNLTARLRPDLLARASYARSLARPNFSAILPSITVPDPTSTNRTLTLSNGNLRPWTADSYGVSLEYYFNQPSAGVISARAFRRDIRDFFGGVTTPLTAEFIQLYDLDAAVYGNGYFVTTQSNVGDAQVYGLELDYRQSLGFLPAWARGLSIFANTTRQSLRGTTTADFTSFAPMMLNGGVTLNRTRYTIQLSANHRGLSRGALRTGAGIAAGVYSYSAAGTYVDLASEFRVTRRFALFANVRNAFNEAQAGLDYNQETPAYARVRSRGETGPLWTVGLKGTF